MDEDERMWGQDSQLIRTPYYFLVIFFIMKETFQSVILNGNASFSLTRLVNLLVHSPTCFSLKHTLRISPKHVSYDLVF